MPAYLERERKREKALVQIVTERERERKQVQISWCCHLVTSFLNSFAVIALRTGNFCLAKIIFGHNKVHLIKQE